MTYSAPPILNVSMPMVNAMSLTGSSNRTSGQMTTASGVWFAANRALFVPIRLPAGVLIKRLWVQVGTTGGTDTWDLGVYTDGGTRIVNMGSTTAGTASTIQFMDITDTYVGPGAYYLAMSSSGTTAHTMKSAPPLPDQFRVAGLLQMATAHPLPATATFAASTIPISAGIPVIGYCTTASP